MRLIFVLLLPGCGTFGLTAVGGVQPSDTGDPGSDAPPVEVALAGQTWSMDLATGEVVEPEGSGAFLALLDSTAVLLSVLDEPPDQLDLAVALTGSDGLQNICQPVLDLPYANFSGNPVMLIDESQLSFNINGVAITMRELELRATIQPDGLSFERGSWQAELDARDLDEALSEQLDLSTCDLLDDMGTDCHDCGDGSESCFNLHLKDLAGQDHGAGFDPEPDTEGC